jgi:hypothetical protein
MGVCRKLASVALVTALFVLGIGPSTSSARPLSRPALAGTTRVLAEKTSVVSVRLPKPVSVRDGVNEIPGFETAGPTEGIVAFALVRDSSELFGLLGGRLPSGAPFFSEDHPIEFLLPLGASGPVPEESSFALPAGDYKLYVITDGPAEVVLTLDGLTGKTGIRARGDVGYDSGVMPTRVDTPGKAVYTAGESGKFDSDNGLVFSYMVIVNRAWVAGEFGRCVAKGEPSGPDPLPWGPHCPTAEEPMVETMQYGPDDVGVENGKGFYSATAGLDAGTYTVSHWYEAASLVDRAASYAFWLDL